MAESPLGEILRAQRARLRLTQAEMGARLGWSRPVITRLESGRPVTVEELLRIARAYELSPEQVGLANVEPTDPPDGLDGGDDVRRRQLLAGVLGVAGATLLGHAPAHAQPVTLRELAKRVTQVQQYYFTCRYSELADALPAAIGIAQATRTANPDRVCDVDALMATLYRHATWLGLRLGEDGLAAGLSEKSLESARASGDLLVEAEAAQMGAVVLRRFKQAERAKQLVVGTAGRLRQETGLANAADRDAYTMLLETGAYTAAISGDRDSALDLHRDATTAARHRHSGPPAALTPSSVDARFLALYGISVHRKLGDLGTAIDIANRINPATITVPERRVRYFEDVALAYGDWGKREPAFHALLEAERIAPQEIRLRPWVKRLTGELLHSGRMLPGLRGFADRAGIR